MYRQELWWPSYIGFVPFFPLLDPKFFVFFAKAVHALHACMQAGIARHTQIYIYMKYMHAPPPPRMPASFLYSRAVEVWRESKEGREGLQCSSVCVSGVFDKWG